MTLRQLALHGVFAELALQCASMKAEQAGSLRDVFLAVAQHAMDVLPLHARQARHVFAAHAARGLGGGVASREGCEDLAEVHRRAVAIDPSPVSTTMFVAASSS